MTPATFEFTVCYGDTDAGGVVYHARYFEIAERARSAAFRDAGLGPARVQEEHGCILALSRADAAFRRPARLDDRLRCESYVTRLGKVRAAWSTEIRRDGELLARVNVELVAVSLAQNRPIELPQAVFDFCRARLRPDA